MTFDSDQIFYFVNIIIDICTYTSIAIYVSFCFLIVLPGYLPKKIQSNAHVSNFFFVVVVFFFLSALN